MNGWCKTLHGKMLKNVIHCCCCLVAQSCLTLCDPMDCSTRGFFVLHYLLEFIQTHIHWTESKLISIDPWVRFNRLILCHPLLLLPSTFSSIRSFPVSQLFASGGQSIGVSASASVLPMNIQDWSPLGWTGWISLQSKGLSRVFSNTTVQKHQFFSTQPSSWFNNHICTWPLEKP